MQMLLTFTVPQFFQKIQEKEITFTLSTFCFLQYMEYVFIIKKILCSHVLHLRTIHSFVVVRLAGCNNPAYSWSFGNGFHIRPHQHHHYQNFLENLASLFGLKGAKFSQKLFYTISDNKIKVICFIQLFSPNSS